MDFGSMALGVTSAASGVVLVVWALWKLWQWKNTPQADLGVAPIVLGLGLVMVAAGCWQTYTSITTPENVRSTISETQD